MTLVERVRSALETIEDPVRRRAVFVGLISDEIEQQTGRRPIVVGGSAVELYTQGAYRSGDIDLKGPGHALLAVLRELGFKPLDRVYYQPDIDICVDFVGEALDEGGEAEARTPEIEVPHAGAALHVRVIALEDLIVDRLAAAKFWQDAESRKWAAVLLYIASRPEFAFDPDYFRARLASGSLVDEYEKVRSTFPEEAVRAMIDRALAAGGGDDV